ncbi:PREDICTED: mRNA-decapping enzyme-like protein [Tarenaya hassleriana]|uniref:mRNA-decapping enzyme-like protein n=1 Tax=Tarenaya hassleriana TaxID=28532 RepID=UPI00053C08B5|nr:PREDICTED: mRNA-decapping enzyme-like protein [Tarenaya hassleriana]
MSQNGKLMPNLDQNSTRLLNLTVLQRIDPYIEEILITAAHVTFYEFNIELSQWSRKDVEGSLFVVKRSTQPRFQFIVMNRRNTDNLVENLLGDFEYEVQGPYLLYRNATQEVNGIWFYNKRECEEVATLFNRILNAYSKVNQKPKASSSKSEFEELEAVPTMAVIDGPLEPSPTTASTADIPDDPAFVNFFSSAMALGNTSNAPASGQPFQRPPAMPPPSHPPPSGAPLIPAAPQIKSQPLPSSAPLMPLLENPDSNSNMNMPANLVKPSTFFVPPLSSSSRMMPPPVVVPSSSVPTAPPHNPNPNLHRPYGAPLLQPFPPPTPPPSLTPTPSPTPNFSPVITRDKVREALLVLVQDNQFIDMVYRALQNAHQP